MKSEDTLRRRQIVCVAIGVTSFLTSLIAGALKIAWLAISGILIFFVCFITIFVLGLIAWRRYG